MGIDFSHCDASWGYIGFNHFRARLATAIGFDWEAFTKILPGAEVSDVVPEPIASDGIFPLLNHSDCDGVLTPEECRLVAPRLRELVAAWPEDDRDKSRALELASGMEAAAEADEDLKFC